MLYQITDTQNCLLITTFIILDFCIIFLFYAFINYHFILLHCLCHMVCF